MKLKNCVYLLVVALCVVSFVACDSDKDDNTFPKVIKAKDITIGGEGVSNNYFYAEKIDTVYVVNSDEELARFYDPRTVSTDMLVISDVDYTKESVLLVGGQATQGIHLIGKSYIQNEKLEYALNVEVIQNETTEAPRWAQAIVVPKLNANAKISYKINYTNRLKN